MTMLLNILDKTEQDSGFGAFDGAQGIFDNMARVVMSFIMLLQRNIWIPVLLIVGICAVAIIGGRKGVEFAKSKIFYVIMAVIILVNVTLIVSSMVTMFGGDSSGLDSISTAAKDYAANKSQG